MIEIDNTVDTKIVQREDIKPVFLTYYKKASFIGLNSKRYILWNNKLVEEGVLQRSSNTITSRDINEHNFISENSYKRIFVFTENYGDRNIAHWMLEQLPVILYYIELLKSDPDIKIIINKNRRANMNSLIKDYILAIPNINPENILNIDLTSIKINADELYIGNSLGCNMTNFYNIWNKIHQNINFTVNNNFITNTNANNKIYISRRNLLQSNKQTNTRIMVNLEDISDLLVNKGYTEIYTDEIDNLKERINLFKSAKEIIMELGAGIYNLLYCPDEIDVKIMYQDNNISWLQEFYPMFKNKKFRVKLISGTKINNKHNGNWLNTPWILNKNKLITYLD